MHDPAAMENARALFPTLDYAPDVEKTCEHADLVLHLTEWKQYRELDPVALAALTRNPRLLDGRNALPTEAWRSVGWTIRSLGRSAR